MRSRGCVPTSPVSGAPLTRRLPRRALEALQGEVHALAERIGTRIWRGGDPAALETIEQGLARVHGALSTMTPAEGLAGFSSRISELSQKIDSVASAGPDPETLRYLEAAINELRELSAGVASAEGIAVLAGDVAGARHAHRSHRGQHRIDRPRLPWRIASTS